MRSGLGGSARPGGPARWTWVLRAYPRWWDARYGDEMRVLLADRPPTWRDTIDLLRGALDAHLHPAGPSRLPAQAALAAGAAWSVVALAVMLEPVTLDWPGLAAWVLPVAVIAAIAVLVATLAVSMRLGDAPGRFAQGARVLVVAASIGWIVALGVAALGGPYGWITGMAASLVAIATVGLGSSLIRSEAGAAGLWLLLVGVALLIPSPVAWVATAISWTAIGLWLWTERTIRVRDIAHGVP